MTFESTPPAYSSVNDFLVYVVYDAHAADPVTYPGYKYVGELWVDGVKVYTKRVFPQPDTNRGELDFSSIIREYVDYELTIAAGIKAKELVPGQFATKSIVVKIREEVDGLVSAVLATDSARTFFNHYNGRYSDFTLLGPYADKVISTRPVRYLNVLFTNGNYFIPFFSETTSAFDVTIVSGATTMITVVTPSVANTMQLINIAPAAVNIQYGGSLITTATQSYTVDIDGTTYYVKILCPGFYTNYILHFWNKFSGFESMLFNKVSRRQNENEKKTWQQKPYRVSSAGVVSVKTGNIMHAQKSAFASRTKEKLQISTDWLSDAEYRWLAELVNSPVVYLEDNGTLYPVNITNNNYEYKEVVVDSLTNLKIDVEFGTMYKAQFR